VAFLACAVLGIRLPLWFWLLPVLAHFIGSWMGDAVVWTIGKSRGKDG
jgi:hypothetical protein